MIILAVLLLPEQRNRRGTKFGEEQILFRCGPDLETAATRLTRVGRSPARASMTPAKGCFVRYKNGNVRLLDFPGAD